MSAGRRPLPARRTVGSAYEELAALLEVHGDHDSVWATLAAGGIDRARLQRLAALLHDEPKASSGGRPTTRIAVAELRGLADAMAAVLGRTERSKATRATALVLMLTGWRSRNGGMVTLDQAPLFHLPETLTGPKRLAMLAKRVGNLTYPPT